MNWLLICVIGILVVCALEGYFRGFIKIVFSLLAMIITLAVVSVAAPKITTYIEENTELDERITEKCLEHVEKNAQDRLDREAQEKSEETRQQLEDNGISGGELDALMDKAAEAGSDAVHQALADSGVYQAMAQKITHFIISLIACIVTYVVVYLVLHISSGRNTEPEVSYSLIRQTVTQQKVIVYFHKRNVIFLIITVEERL